MDMSGIYIHIPFCKQACHYCNFHFSTSLKYKAEMVEAIVREIQQRRDYLEGASVDTIYFGGGTPSLLETDEINRILDTIDRLHTINPNPEITIEANPDDLLKKGKLKALSQTAINRLSIGIQSYADADLKFMNRAHNGAEAHTCIEAARQHGFSNITIDLIYGSPTTSDEQWARNIQQTLDYDIPHISCYCLTVEEKTALHHFVQTGKAQPVDEEQAARQFEYMVDTLTHNGYDHYEISNFGKPGWYARHNSSYWLGTSYLGIGPSAHSFNGASRQWNVAHNMQYIKGIAKENPAVEIEYLTKAQRYNEYVMTSLRTIWGVDLQKVQAYGVDYATHFINHIAPYISGGQVQMQENRFQLTTAGKFLADGIASDLFWDNEPNAI
jgi:oxygen-independent coproporphyrinogen-3 oxidase